MPFKPLLRAFPSVLVRDSRGMLLRDYFASDAMKGLSSDPGWRQDMDFYDTARAAYSQADAMLRVREEKSEQAQEETVTPGTWVQTGGEE